ncbi:Hpt domain-containing protein [bacterium]|nr:Hpt domain-containing protein [bacterium]
MLESTDCDACERVAKLLLDYAESVSADKEQKNVAREAAELCLRIGSSTDPDSDLERLNRFIEMIQNPDKESKNSSDSSSIIDDAMVAEFLQKQESVLQDFEASCLEMENGDLTKYSELKRQIHTWKGDSAILGLQELSDKLHKVEDALEDTAKEDYGKIPDALLKLKDILASYFNDLLRTGTGAVAEIDEVIDKLTVVWSEAEPAELAINYADEAEDIQSDAAPEVEVDSTATSNMPIESKEFEIPPDVDNELVNEFRTESEEHIHNAEVALMSIESDPSDMDAVNVVFRAFHTIKGVASFVGLSYITEMAHKAENFLDRVRKGDLTLEGVYTDLAFEALDMLKHMIANMETAIENGRYTADCSYFLLIKRLENPTSASIPQAPKAEQRKEPVGQILVSGGKADPIAVEEALRKQADGDRRPIGELLVEEKAAKASDVVQAVRSQQADTAGVKAKSNEGTVKVSTSRLDNLINSVGELVIAQSMVSQDPDINRIASQSLSRNVSQLIKITRSLQELALSMRMVSVKPTFQKMARLVRDLARKSGKDVAFEMHGEDTELDRNMVEAIADPLVHMVRNAVDHGIERSDIRIANNKDPQGLVTLSAAHEGGSVVISLRDDGKGLDKERIYAKALERGIIDPNTQLTDSDMYNLVFQPGFSTAEKVTDVSGRGVGMDVVRTNIEKLRGSVIIDSEPGKGSIFKMRLPLTLAIIDGMVIRVGDQRFIIPTVAITESFRTTMKDIVTVRGRTEMVSLRGQLIPISRLHHIFDIKTGKKSITEGILVVAEGKDSRVALMADEMLGQQQVVIKRLGDIFDGMSAVSGGAILGDGTVSLILDIEGILRLSSEVPVQNVRQFSEAAIEA